MKAEYLYLGSFSSAAPTTTDTTFSAATSDFYLFFHLNFTSQARLFVWCPIVHCPVNQLVLGFGKYAE